MAKKFIINEELFNEVFSPISEQQAEFLKNQIYAVIDETEDKCVEINKISESNVDDFFSVRSTLKIINIE